MADKNCGIPTSRDELLSTIGIKPGFCSQTDLNEHKHNRHLDEYAYNGCQRRTGR